MERFDGMKRNDKRRKSEGKAVVEMTEETI